MADIKDESIAQGEEKIAELKPKAEEKKTNSSVEPIKNGSINTADLENKIIEQIEYYFGDCNLPRDKFLQQQLKLDDGWVPLEVMIKFNRLAKLSTDTDIIAAALKKSDKGLIEVSEDNKKIRRDPSNVLPEMNEARRQELVQRSLYVKGFPTEDIELDTLLNYFNNHVKVEQIIMRKFHDKAEKKWVFKGSVFAIFPSVEEAEKFTKIENLKYDDVDLTVKWQKDYIEYKKNSRLQSKLENQSRKRKLQEDDDKKEDEDIGEEKKDGLAKGAALYLSDCPSELTREEVKSKIEELGIGVAYLYFNKGDKEGWVRLQEADSATEVVKNLKDGKLELKDSVVAIRALEGEEEEKFLMKVKDDMAKRRNQNKGHRAKRGRGGNFNRRKRKGSPVRNFKGKRTTFEADSD